jgi:hypothetical protein
MNAKEDILAWVKEFIEVNHEFYNYKFPPCPYAKSARLAGLLNIVACETNITDFVYDSIRDIILDSKYTVTILVLPDRARYYFWIRWWVSYINRILVKADYYAQYGVARVKDREYRIIIVNKLSDIISGHESLIKTDYYKNWTAQHYNAVVTRRQKIMDKKR